MLLFLLLWGGGEDLARDPQRCTCCCLFVGVGGGLEDSSREEVDDRLKRDKSSEKKEKEKKWRVTVKLLRYRFSLSSSPSMHCDAYLSSCVEKTSTFQSDVKHRNEKGDEGGNNDRFISPFVILSSTVLSL
jgi:hypothetical protein